MIKVIAQINKKGGVGETFFHDSVATIQKVGSASPQLNSKPHKRYEIVHTLCAQSNP